MSEAAQFMLDGTIEPFQRQDGGGIKDFMRVSVEESGLLSPSQAAHVLGVSAQRLGQLMTDGTLRRWNFFGKPYVSAAEVMARRQEDVRAGRPTRSAGAKFKVAAKVLLGHDARQWAAEMLQ